MTKARRAVEWIKSILIVLLLTSALLLGWRTQLFDDVVKAIPLIGSFAELVRSSSGAGATGGVSLKEAARPMCIVITNETGARFGVKYDTDLRNTIYDRTSSIMGEALGSASLPQEVDEEEWRAALAGPNIYFEYNSPVRLSILDGWLGTHIPEESGDIALRRLFIAFSGNKSSIYLQEYESGLFYHADTASSAGKAQELDDYVPNGALFAYELEITGSDNAPYMLIMPGQQHPDVRTASAGSQVELLEALVTALGHSNEPYTVQPERDRALRRVGTQYSVVIDVNGRAVYRRTDAIAPGDGDITVNEREMIERARAIAAETIGKTCGAADVFFESMEMNSGNSYTALFGYYIAGGFVHLYDDRYAARITFTSGAITDVELDFRSFAFTGEYEKLYLERQALAASGGEFVLCYPDTGAELIKPVWVSVG